MKPSHSQPAPAAAPPAVPEALAQSAFLKACRGEPTPYTPIWLMRQAGRYMAEYQAVRRKVSILELCKTPALAAEVTVTARNRIGADAAIIFADILLVLEPLGFELEFLKGEGPIIYNPIREPAQVDALREVDVAGQLGFVPEAVRQCRAALPADVPLIGFCGAPFTLASYVLEGGGFRRFEQTKAFMYREPGAWHALLDRLHRTLAAYLNAQIAAGAQAVQVFDSWVGCLGPDDYREFVWPHSRALLEAITPGVPVIHFGVGTGALLELMRDAGGATADRVVMGIDFQTDLAAARERLGDTPVQGNLDPCVLLTDPAFVQRRAQQVLDRAAGRPGHIFNLGHGVLPATPVEHVIALVEYVHEASQR